MPVYGGRLFKSNVFNCAVPAYIFDPTDISTMYQTDPATTAVASSNDPIGWYRSKGFAWLPATQSTANFKPQYQASYINSTPAVVGDGSNDFLRVTNLPIIPQPLTVIFAAKIGTVVNSAMFFDCGGTSTNRARFNVSSTGFLAMVAGSTVASTTAADTNPHVYCLVYNGTSSKMYRDGILIAAGNAGTQGIEGLTLMASRTGANCLTGGIGRFVMVGEDLSASPQKMWAIHRWVEAGHAITDSHTYPEHFLGIASGVTTIPSSTQYDAWV